MHRALLIASCVAAIVACGAPFTAETVDGGGSGGDTGAGSGDTGSSSDGAAGSGKDGSTADATTGDASTRDAASDSGGGGSTDAIVGTDGTVPLCMRMCPTGFACALGKCVDRATPHFNVLSASSGNWTDGYFADLGATFQPDSNHWVSNGSIDVWTNTGKDTFEPSVFHNRSLVSVDANSMTVPGDALGLFPSSQGAYAALRWVAPAAGTYQIDATFTGISTPPPVLFVGLRFNLSVGGSNTSMDLNLGGSGNVFTYSDTQTVTAGEPLYFYAGLVPNREDMPGGCSLDVKITAQ